jgi:putative ABC transport system permease protein
MLADIRYAIRSFRKTPGFTVIVVLTAALGIGANTAIFTVVNAVLLRPFPYDDPDSLVRVRRGSSHPDMQDWVQQAQSFSAIGGFRAQLFDYSGDAEAERLDGALVTGTALQLFGARTLMGRVIEPADDRVGAAPVAAISARFWRSRLGSDPAIVGRRLTFNGATYTIVGVLDSGFSLPAMEADVFAPYLPAAGREATARGAHTLRAFLRLKPGVAIGQAQQEMDAIALRLQQEHPETNHEMRFPLQALGESVVGSIRPALMILLATVGLVLLIACVNVANLLIARGAARRGELAVKAAIGATRARLTRQLLTESLLLAAAGGVLALVVAYWLTQAIVGLAPADVPRLDSVALDVRVLGFTALLSLVTGVIFGVLPAWTGASVSLADASRASGRSTGAGAARGALLVIEFALALVLVVGAGLLLRSFVALTSKEPGFDTRGLVTANITLSGERYGDIPARTLLFQQLEERLRARPGVSDVAMTTDLPIGGLPIFHNLAFEGRSMPAGTEPEVYYRGVSPGYFRALGISLLAGRPFAPQDRPGAPLVAIVNQSFVREYYPDADPVGRRIRWASGDGTWITIVGVVADVRALSLDQSEVPAVHVPYAQEQMPWRRWMDVAVRVEGNPLALTSALRAELAGIDRTVPLARVRSMDQVIAVSMADRRFNLFLLGGFALLALILAAAGTYGVMSYTVVQRTRELGVRMALGARRRDVLKLVVGRGMALAAVGVAVGAGAALLLSRLIADMLFEIPARDPFTMVVSALTLLLSAAAASYIPARRAMRVDPLVALRSE